MSDPKKKCKDSVYIYVSQKERNYNLIFQYGTFAAAFNRTQCSVVLIDDHR